MNLRVCFPPGSSVHGIFATRILEWVSVLSSRASSRPSVQTHVSCIAGGFFTTEPQGKPNESPCSVAQSCLTFCDPIYLQNIRIPCPSPSLELAQSHVHWVGDAIQTSCPLSSPSAPAFNLSQHQSLFQLIQLFTSGDQSIGASASASVLPMNTQDWFPLRWTRWISLQSKGLSKIFSNTTVQKHQFFSGSTLASVRDYLKNHSFDYMGLCQQNNAFDF